MPTPASSSADLLNKVRLDTEVVGIDEGQFFDAALPAACVQLAERGVTCIAPNIGTEQTFVLLDEWVPDPHRPERDEALGLMATRYFRSHGPTTRQDFAGWMGSTAADAKRGIAVAGDALATVEVDGVQMLLDRALLDADRAAATVEAATVEAAATEEWLALPGFDEYLLGFKDRSLMVADEHKQAIIPGGNGVFQSTIVRDGRVVATWKRSTLRARTVVTVRPLTAFTAGDRGAAEAALLPYARFVERPVEVLWDPPT